MTVEEFLRDAMVQAKEKYPDTGFLLVAMDDNGAEHFDLVVMTNLEEEELVDVIESIPTEGDDDEYLDDEEPERRLN